MYDIDLFNYFEKNYFNELEMREKINNRLQVQLSIMVGIVTLGGYIIMNSLRIAYGIAYVAMIVSISVACIAFIISLWLLIKNMCNRNYAFMPFPNDVEEYYQKRLNKYSSKPEPEETANKDLICMLGRKYKQAAQHNKLLNTERSFLFYRTSLSLAWSCIGLLAGAGFFVTCSK